jgi:superfamily II DNA/RNA helicase
MLHITENQKRILQKLGIEHLKPMQEEAFTVIQKQDDIVLLSPTGSGKTLAFLLPLIDQLDPKCEDIQLLILVPSRELAIQIEQVIRNMATGFKANAIYGGRSGSKDKSDLKHLPAILIGTPGRIADRFRRDSFSLEKISTLVLDEFDKSLEIGFEKEMSEIVAALSSVRKRILTSATQKAAIPDFMGILKPFVLNYLEDGVQQLKVKTIVSPDKDKLDTLVDCLCHIGNQPGIIFCNYRDSIDRVSEFLDANKISHGCFHGGMEQIDREKSLIKFRNGTHQILVATDLAARGLDIPELKFILHYQLPKKDHEFTHRNGRTARMDKEGTAYVIKWVEEDLPSFIKNAEEEKLQDAPIPQSPSWRTLYITGGRKDKISKGDIAGLLMKQAGLSKEDVGMIEIKQESSFVAVKLSKVNRTIKAVNNSKLKKKKVRVSLI